uniref:Uncharacterized protein n=1 Tax=Vespula pensylvanica TaxID=30213 RepID=A0A834P685_VESPE|nr:hypothetical protein H0235_006242 [Vespula pensylvanica]
MNMQMLRYVYSQGIKEVPGGYEIVGIEGCAIKVCNIATVVHSPKLLGFGSLAATSKLRSAERLVRKGERRAGSSSSSGSGSGSGGGCDSGMGTKQEEEEEEEEEEDVDEEEEEEEEEEGERGRDKKALQTHHFGSSSRNLCVQYPTTTC